MNPVRIIGIGSPFGADTLGIMAAKRLSDSNLVDRFPPGTLSIRVCDRPGVGLLDEIRDAELAILIDAARFGGHTGEIRRFTEKDIEGAVTVRSSHDLGVAETLALGRSLAALPPELVLYGIEIGPEGCPKGLDEITTEGIASLKNAIEADIGTYRQLTGH